MKWLAISLAGLLSTACATAPLAELAAELARFDDDPVQVAVVVRDLDTGETLLARDAGRLFRPASTMKLLTTSGICRSDHAGTLRTQLRVDALPAGRATLVGAGDPLLSTADLRALAQKLREQGVTEVRGPIRVVDPLAEGNRFGVGWMWDDEPSTFQPAMSAAVVNGGCVTVEATGGPEDLEARLLPVAGALELRVEGGDSRLAVTRGRYREPDVVGVTGKTNDGGPVRRRITVPDPARFSGHVLLDALQRAGIATTTHDVEVVSAVTDAKQPAAVATLQRPLADVVIRTNKVSDNLGAELLLRRLGALHSTGSEQLGRDSEFDGLEALESSTAAMGLPVAPHRFADGSGVSHYNLVSAEMLVGLLSAMHSPGDPGSRLFRESLPIAGVDGTLKNRMQGTAAESRVFAKTGTVSGVSNLAGYVETTSGRNLAFAILCQNFVGSSRPWRELQDRICATLATM